ncbi:16S rRNA (cytosine(967)-C(5))-methyltransferase RsmB [Alteribacillus bidgolensis]|uniref:16S rRNA (cytosine(967)-C(5))-methyltransferase n=1 Tax=Alteribacillus bidgolensis TaxID=930129 RepID=A0A1G8GCL8_9BACI|nr:16S rRNA (cytosine(967)-C(5))-methyltransferase RsmB [Alteribacillus bidgolensis]SDH92070.1 16S rRNA (cytosine967-C5)-methyltransferase [Alteribacillus bidgolensis]
MTNNFNKNVREKALELLQRIEKEGAYSHLLLNHVLSHGQVSKKDESLLTELVYGTIKRKNTLDFYLTPFLKNGIDSIEPWVLQLLRLSVYQLVYLDRVPDRAVIHEAVNIAKKRGHKGISGLVNGVLRSIQRKGLPRTNSLSGIERLAIETSHPEWLLEDWIAAYGEKEAKAMALTNLDPPPLTVRVNLSKSTKEEIKNKLLEEGCQIEEGALSPDALIITSGSVITTETYKNGYVTIQDESSMLVARLLQPEPGMRVLDACAAPGGKTTHLAECMEDKGSINAFDLHKKKIKLIEEQAKRLGLSIIEAKAMDARELTAHLDEQFDRVLVDAPCSGLGVIRRKPELKWQKQKENLERFPKIQADILAEASKLVKPGGMLVYSTCTVRKEENEDVVEAFLSQNNLFKRERNEFLANTLQAEHGQKTILPQQFGTDGFFMALLKKQDL